jgi:hypothetical protein
MRLLRFTVFLLIAPIKSFILPFFHQIPEVTTNILHNLPEDVKIKIVEDTTGLLPRLDRFSHLMLTNNERLIDGLLHSDINPDIKKKIILKLVDFLREGDEMGGVILLQYYNLLDTLI